MVFILLFMRRVFAVTLTAVCMSGSALGQARTSGTSSLLVSSTRLWTSWWRRPPNIFARPSEFG